MHTIFSPDEQNCKQRSKHFMINIKTDNDKRITMSSLSCVFMFSCHWYRFALHSSAAVNVIFLPLHVETLLILCLENVVGYCQSGICYIGFLSCRCVALSSLFYLFKSLSRPKCHSHADTDTLIQVLQLKPLKVSDIAYFFPFS